MPTKKTTSPKTDKPKAAATKKAAAAKKPVAKKELSTAVGKELATTTKKEVATTSTKQVSVKNSDLATVAPKKAKRPAPVKTDAVINLETAKKPVAKKATAAKNTAAKKTVAPKAAAPKATAAKPAKPVAPKATSAKPVAKKDNTKHVLFVGSECAPFAGTGGLGEVLGSLPKAINASSSGVKASVILPLYESVAQEYRDKFEFIRHIYVPVSWRKQYCGLFKYVENGVEYFFVDNEYYFKRPNIYGYYDDAERYAFFSRAVLELLPHLGFDVDILHCHDWQSALVPIYYKLFYMYRDGYVNIKNIFTIHNIEYQGKYPDCILEDVFGIDNSELSSVSFDGCINLLKGAIDYSDAVSTVSPTYAKELQDPFYAHGLADVIAANSHKMRGILNGIDTDVYNPKTNPALFSHYDASNIADKTKNKLELQAMLDLTRDPNIPMVAIISRLVCHKGLDLVRFAFDEMLKLNMQLVILGKGDSEFENYFTHMHDMYDKKVASIIAYNKDLSHKVYSAADMFLMPSKSEPCGLSQMMSCRYGTVPIVRSTGGLKDSITDCGNGDVGNGFVFGDYDAASMLHAISRAVGLYSDYRHEWDGLVKRCLASDFSWNKSAKEYINFYNEL